jgi:hypothetical protein
MNKGQRDESDRWQAWRRKVMSKRDVMIKLGCTRSLANLRPRWEDIKRYFKK